MMGRFLSSSRRCQILTALFLALLTCSVRAGELVPATRVYNAIDAVELRVGGITFRIPRNYLDTYIELDSETPEEVAGGFTMVALLPDFAMREQSNIAKFIGTSGEQPPYRSLIMTNVRRLCPTIEPPCSPTEVFDAIQAAQVEPRRMGSSKPTDEVLPGLRYAGVADQFPALQGVSSREVYLAAEAQAGFIVCVSGIGERCRHFMRWRDNLYLEMDYSRPNLSDWQNIAQRVTYELQKYSNL